MNEQVPSKDVTTFAIQPAECATHRAEHHLMNALPCPWCVIDELKRNRDEWKSAAQELDKQRAAGWPAHEPPPEQPSVTEIIRQMKGRAAESEGGTTIEVLISDLRSVVTGMQLAGASPPPGLEVPILRNCLGNLFAAVQRFAPIDADIQFAMREAAQALGPPYSTATKPPALPRMIWDPCSKGGLWKCDLCDESYCSPPWSRDNAAKDHAGKCPRLGERDE
jgi:hypothetical protein